MFSFRSYSSLIFLAAVVSTPLQAQMTVSVSPSLKSPATLGTPVNWTANVSGASPGTLVYRFRIWHASREVRTLVDFGPKSSLAWTTIDEEGAYQMEASVRNVNTGAVAAGTVAFTFSPIAGAAASGAPMVTPSANPQVFIYTAPTCRDGRIRVQFQSAGEGVQSTRSQPCLPGHSMNFYLAGMLPNAPCTAKYIVDENGGGVVTGSAITFTPPPSAIQPPPVTLLTKGTPPTVDGVLLQSLLSGDAVATDLSGNILWYGPSDINELTRPVTGGTFMGIYENDAEDPSQQFFREFDLAGFTVAETNAAQVSRQLVIHGAHPINAFHHEARKLPDGKYLVLAEYDTMLTNVQGPGPVDVIGDVILVLDRNLQVLWSWDSFQHLDTTRMAVLNETCLPGNAGCSPWYLATMANDWVHGNALQLTPDGNILYSMRNQDWVIKIDYENGAGNGNVIWRLGKGGDFQIVSSDPSPWFSGQHDANFLPDNVSLLIYDDGNTRYAADQTVHSRGQLFKMDQQNKVATLVLNADLGTYASAVGSAQALPNGDYHFDSGFIYIPTTGALVSQTAEVNASGDIVYGIGFGIIEYRTFRMPDLYTAP